MLVLLVISAFLLIPFVHGSHSFQCDAKASECQTDYSQCYVCKYAKSFTFAVPLVVPLVFAVYLVQSLPHYHLPQINTLTILRFSARAPPLL